MHTAHPTALIADDEAPLRDFLRKRLAAAWPELQIVAQAQNGVEAAAMIAELAPTVAFLDIKMPGQSGLEVAQGIETATRVVFVTAYDRFALDAFETEAIDYLVKPVDAQRLARTCACAAGMSNCRCRGRMQVGSGRCRGLSRPGRLCGRDARIAGVIPP